MKIFITIIGFMLLTVCHAQVNIMLKNITALEGSNVKIPCTYDAPSTDDIPTIKWFAIDENGKKSLVYTIKKDGKIARSPEMERNFGIGDNGELMIPEAAISDNKLMPKLVCKLIFDRSTTAEGQLSFSVVAFADAPPITTLTNSVFDRSTEPVNIGKCETGNAYPEPTIAFYRGGEKIESEENDPTGDEALDTDEDFVYSDFLNPSIITDEGAKMSISKTLFRPLTKEDNMVTFYCVVTSGGGNSPETMRVQNVSFDQFHVRYPTDSVTVFASSDDLFIGEEVTFTCEVNGYPTPSINFQGQSSNTFQLEIQKEDHGRQIACKTSTGEGNTSIEDTYTINVLYADDPMIEGSSELGYGESGIFSCTGQSNPPPRRIVWKRNGQTVSDSAQLVINDAKFTDAGTYICEVTNDYQKLTRSANHSVTVKGLMFENAGDEKAKGVLDETITLTCTAKAFPTPTFTWTRKSDGKSADSKEEQKGNMYISTIMVGPLRPSMSKDMYECRVTAGTNAMISKMYSLPEFGFETTSQETTTADVKTPQTAGSSAVIVIIVIVVVLIIIIAVFILQRKGYICKKTEKGDEDAEDIQHVKMTKSDGVVYTSPNDVETGRHDSIERSEEAKLMNGNGDQ